MEPTPPTTTPPGEPAATTRPRWLIPAGVIAVALAIALVVVLTHDSGSSSKARPRASSPTTRSAQGSKSSRQPKGRGPGSSATATDGSASTDDGTAAVDSSDAASGSASASASSAAGSSSDSGGSPSPGPSAGSTGGPPSTGTPNPLVPPAATPPPSAAPSPPVTPEAIEDPQNPPVLVTEGPQGPARPEPCTPTGPPKIQSSLQDGLSPAGHGWVTVGRLSGNCGGTSGPFSLGGHDARVVFRSDAEQLVVFVDDLQNADANAGYADVECRAPCAYHQDLTNPAGNYQIRVDATDGPWEIEVQEYR